MKYPSSCVERFLRYVKVDTRSDETSPTYPSTAGQWDLLRMLEGELRELGLEAVELDEYGYLFATIPATTSKDSVPTIGFLAHVDTSPELSGKGVEPIRHENYDGGDLTLPREGVVLRAAEHPALADQRGETIITASGDTLLGADNKAGVAEIVGAAEYLIAHPEIAHGPIRIGFTPDEEIGKGTDYFDVERFGARCAYTMDGESRGARQDETFSADGVVITFQGRNAHPGFAEGAMDNALKAAGAFLAALPHELSPEGTSGRDGFVHPYTIEGGVERCSIRMILRDFETAKLARYADELRRLAEATGMPFELEVTEQYRNMKEILDDHPEVVAVAEEAIRRAGMTPTNVPIRGGTDGARLCFKGLPTPNVFAGEHAFHSRTEWVSEADMHKAVEVIVEIARLWEERA